MFGAEGGNGTDLSSMTPMIANSSVNNSSGVLSTALSVKGSGILTGITQLVNGSAANGSLKITIDGNVIYNDTSFVVTAGMTSIALMHAFNQSLQIETANSATSGSATYTKIAYLLD